MRRTLKESDKKIVACNQRWECGKCKSMLPSTYQIDHIIPYSISFNDDISNLEALCPNCHSKKTQTENFRINSFKKLCSLKETSLCWFCLEDLTYDHECDKVLNKIVFEKPKLSNENRKSNVMDKFIYTEEEEEEIDRTLRVKIRDDLIWVNNFFTILKEDTTVNDLAWAINVATRSKKEMGFYDNVEIDIDMNPYDEEDLETPMSLVEHFEEELPKLINVNIFKKDVNVEYDFIVL